MARCPKGQKLVRKSGPKIHGEFCEQKTRARRSVDPRSYRWVHSGRAHVLTACPRGKWDARKGRCRAGLRSTAVLRPAKRSASANLGGLPAVPAVLKNPRVKKAVVVGGAVLAAAGVAKYFGLLGGGALALTGTFTVDPTRGTIAWAPGTLNESFLAAGFTAGGKVTASGFQNAGNNGTFEIAEASASFLLLKDPKGLVAETGVASLSGTNAQGEKVPTEAQLAAKANTLFAAALGSANAIVTGIATATGGAAGAAGAALFQAPASTVIASAWGVTPDSTKAKAYTGVSG